MTRPFVPALASVFVAVLVASCALPTVAFAQHRAPDGVTINEEGQPQSSTFSLCAIDPATGQSGAAVTTRVPFVGRAVPWARAGIGAVCTQASTMVEYGVRGLDLMAQGVEPQRRHRAAPEGRRGARIAAARDDRHEGPLRRAHRQEQRRLGRQPAGRELHGAGEHHGRSGGGGGRRAHVRVHRGHGDAAGRAHDSVARSGVREGRRPPLGQPAVRRDQGGRSERSRPRQRSHHAGDRGRRACRPGRRDEAHLLHHAASPRLSHVLAHRRRRTSSS